MPNETQQSINQWQRETFGPQDRLGPIEEKLQDELYELAVTDPDDTKYAEELADLQIVLYQLAGAAEVDLVAAVDRKMLINRARKWDVRGDGTAQHIKDSSE